MICSGTVDLGHPVMSATTANYVMNAPDSISGSAILGYAEESGDDEEVIIIRVDL